MIPLPCCANCGWLEIIPNNVMFCRYSNEPTWEENVCLAWKHENEPCINADCIRAMTDEELAIFLKLVGGRGPCHDQEYCNTRQCCGDGYECWLSWLKR